MDELLLPGDALRVGGNRQVSGAEIVCEAVEPCPDELRQQFLLLQHLRCNPADNAAALSGELERIVLRRTRTEDGWRSDNSGRSGFGQHHVDWGCHLAPGWNGLKEQDCQPVQAEDGSFRHGTVEPV